MFLKAGRPKSAKEKAIAAVTDTSDEVPAIVPEAPPAPPAKPKMQRFNVDLPDTLHRALKAQAAKEGVKLNALTVRLFEEYLSKVSNE